MTMIGLMKKMMLIKSMDRYFFEEMDKHFFNELNLFWKDVISNLKNVVDRKLYQSSKIFLRLENDWEMLYNFDDVIAICLFYE